jgi:hypothetical protein
MFTPADVSCCLTLHRRERARFPYKQNTFLTFTYRCHGRSGQSISKDKPVLKTVTKILNDFRTSNLQNYLTNTVFNVFLSPKYGSIKHLTVKECETHKLQYVMIAFSKGCESRSGTLRGSRSGSGSSSGSSSGSGSSFGSRSNF